MSAIVEYVREAWPTVSATVGDTLRKTYEVVVDGVVLGRPTWLSRRIDDWSQHTFPPATAKVVAAAIVALPFVALFFLTPPVIANLTCIAPYLGRIVTLKVEGKYDSLSYNAYINSMALLAIMCGIGSIVGVTFGKGRITLPTGRITFPVATYEILIGCGAFYYTHFLQDTVEAGKELYDRLFRGANIPSATNDTRAV